MACAEERSRWVAALLRILDAIDDDCLRHAAKHGKHPALNTAHPRSHKKTADGGDSLTRQGGSRRLLGAGFVDDDIIRIGIGDHRESQRLSRREFTPFGFENKNVHKYKVALDLSVTLSS